MDHPEAAASKLQAWARRTMSTKKVAAAAVKLQAFARLVLAKRELARANTKENAAVKLQAWARRTMSTKDTAQVTPMAVCVAGDASIDISSLGIDDSFDEGDDGSQKKMNASYSDPTIQGYIAEAEKGLLATKKLVAGIASPAKASGEYCHSNV